MTGTDLRGYFGLNVRRRAAARDYLELFRNNRIDAILMPPAAHTAVPLDKWNKATYTGLWNYLDYPAAVIPVDSVRDIDLADDLSNAKYGAEDASLYSLCMKHHLNPFTVAGLTLRVSLLRYWSWPV